MNKEQGGWSHVVRESAQKYQPKDNYSHADAKTIEWWLLEGESEIGKGGNLYRNGRKLDFGW